MRFTNNHVRCSCCKYVRPDYFSSGRKWTAYECSNSKSEYYRCLLNIGEDGAKLRWIAWPGCENGDVSEAPDAL